MRIIHQPKISERLRGTPISNQLIIPDRKRSAKAISAVKSSTTRFRTRPLQQSMPLQGMATQSKSKGYETHFMTVPKFGARIRGSTPKPLPTSSLSTPPPRMPRGTIGQCIPVMSSGMPYPTIRASSLPLSPPIPTMMPGTSSGSMSNISVPKGIPVVPHPSGMVSYSTHSILPSGSIPAPGMSSGPSSSSMSSGPPSSSGPPNLAPGMSSGPPGPTTSTIVGPPDVEYPAHDDYIQWWKKSYQKNSGTSKFEDYGFLQVDLAKEVQQSAPSQRGRQQFQAMGAASGLGRAQHIRRAASTLRGEQVGNSFLCPRLW